MLSVAEELDGLAAAVWRAAPDGVLVVDSAGTILHANPAAARVLAGSPDATLAGPLSALIVPRDDVTLDVALAAARAGGWRGEVTAGRGSGAGPFDLRLVPLDAPPDAPRLVGLLRDLGEEHARERARAELLSTVLHDVKGPLTVILGYAELLADPQEEPTRETFVDTLSRIADCGEQIHALVSNFGIHSRIQTGRLPTDRRPVDVAEIVGRLAEQFATRAARKDVEWVFSGEPLPEVPGDRTQIERALANVLGNAVKFTPPGGRVTLATSCADGALLLAVEDTGPGVAPDDHERIFAKYQARVPGRRGEGAGLGLAVARGIARAHGGDLTVSSTAGAGARFTLRLPLDAEAGQP
jgi:signal transduction histidine kinase